MVLTIVKYIKTTTDSFNMNNHNINHNDNNLHLSFYFARININQIITIVASTTNLHFKDSHNELSKMDPLFINLPLRDQSRILKLYHLKDRIKSTVSYWLMRIVLSKFNCPSTLQIHRTNPIQLIAQSATTPNATVGLDSINTTTGPFIGYKTTTKPFIQNHPWLDFNVAHDGDHVVVAGISLPPSIANEFQVTNNETTEKHPQSLVKPQIGIDITFVLFNFKSETDAIDYINSLIHVLSPKELQFVTNISKNFIFLKIYLLHVFFALKESTLKAIGLGISSTPDLQFHDIEFEFQHAWSSSFVENIGISTPFHTFLSSSSFPMFLELKKTIEDLTYFFSNSCTIVCPKLKSFSFHLELLTDNNDNHNFSQNQKEDRRVGNCTYFHILAIASSHPFNFSASNSNQNGNKTKRLIPWDVLSSDQLLTYCQSFT